MFKAISKRKRKEKPYCELRQALDQWYKGGIGQQFIKITQPPLDEILSNLFGYHLLQVGSFANANLLEKSRTNQCLVLDDCQENLKHPLHIVPADVAQLPITTDSIDVVVLPHTLEIHANAYQILREVDRILVPEGHVVITGFNPYSLWGCSMWLRKLIGHLPWHGRFLSPRRVSDWCGLLGYDIESVQFYFHRLPLNASNIMKKTKFLERWGARFWPILGGGYILVARKQVITPTPIRPSWHFRSRFGALTTNRSSMQREKPCEKD